MAEVATEQASKKEACRKRGEQLLLEAFKELGDSEAVREFLGAVLPKKMYDDLCLRWITAVKLCKTQKGNGAYRQNHVQQLACVADKTVKGVRDSILVDGSVAKSIASQQAQDWIAAETLTSKSLRAKSSGLKKSTARNKPR